VPWRLIRFFSISARTACATCYISVSSRAALPWCNFIVGRNGEMLAGRDRHRQCNQLCCVVSDHL
jgi:hypothetical protein